MGNSKIACLYYNHHAQTAVANRLHKWKSLHVYNQTHNLFFSQFLLQTSTVSMHNSVLKYQFMVEKIQGHLILRSSKVYGS